MIIIINMDHKLISGRLWTALFWFTIEDMGGLAGRQ
jgi:hypothetical protein